jgi:hypothetical protein
MPVGVDLAVDDATFVLEDAGLVLDEVGFVLDDAGLVLEDAGLVLEDAGLVLEDAGLLLDVEAGLLVEVEAGLVEDAAAAELELDAALLVEEELGLTVEEPAFPDEDVPELVHFPKRGLHPVPQCPDVFPHQPYLIAISRDLQIVHNGTLTRCSTPLQQSRCKYTRWYHHS